MSRNEPFMYRGYMSYRSYWKRSLTARPGSVFLERATSILCFFFTWNLGFSLHADDDLAECQPASPQFPSQYPSAVYRFIQCDAGRQSRIRALFDLIVVNSWIKPRVRMMLTALLNPLKLQNQQRTMPHQPQDSESIAKSRSAPIFERQWSKSRCDESKHFPPIAWHPLQWKLYRVRAVSRHHSNCISYSKIDRNAEFRRSAYLGLFELTANTIFSRDCKCEMQLKHPQLITEMRSEARTISTACDIK